MNILTKSALGLLSVGVLVSGASFASAATEIATGTPVVEARGGCKGKMHAEEHAAHHAAQQEKLAAFLGVSVADLETARKNKTSLEDLAISKGKTKEQLQTFFEEQRVAHHAELKAKLDAEVAAGTLTAEKRDAMLKRMEQKGMKKMGGKFHGMRG